MSISADGYEELRAAIVSGDLPPGERLLVENAETAAARAVQE